MIISPFSVGNEAVAGHYDELDFFHRDVWGEHLHHGFWKTGRESIGEATRQLSLRAIAPLGVRPGHRVIDVGSGYGATCRMLAEEFGCVVSGYTVSKLQHDRAVASRNRSRIEYHQADWLRNRESDVSADGVISIECVSHVADKRAFFSEVFRVLKPGGCCVVCCWLVKEGTSQRTARWLLEPICRGGQMPGIGTMDDYRELIAGAGFELESSEEIDREVRRTWRKICGRIIQKTLSDRIYRKFLFRPNRQNLGRAATILRVMAACYGGWLRYGFFVMRKPEAPLSETASSRDRRFSG